MVDPPIVMVIEPTNRCNMRCAMCPHGLQGSFGDMPMWLFERTASQIPATTKLIQLYLLGEPTLHPRLIDMIQALKAQTSAVVELSTNLSWATDAAYAAALVHSGLDRVLCCIEGSGPESHNRLRTTSSFKSAVEAVHQLARVARESGRGVDIVVKLIETRFNAQERGDFSAYWSSVAGVRVATSWLNTWAGSMPQVRDFATRLSPNEHRARQPCAELWNKLVVRWNGDVVLCCHDWQSAHPLGNVRNLPLSEIWSGDEVLAWRRAHLSGDFHGLCNKCIEWSVPQEYSEDYGIEPCDVRCPGPR